MTMLKARVIANEPGEDCYGKEGVVVAVNTCFDRRREYTVCKVLVGDRVSNWIDYRRLNTVKKELEWARN